MSEPIDKPAAATRAQIIAVALALGRSLDLWSLALVMLALFVLFWMPLPIAPMICLLLSLLAGGIQKIFALRVAFDEALFRHWAEIWSTAVTPTFDPTSLTTDLAALDQALVACGLLPALSKVFRDLDSRLQGALRLLKKQILAFIIQLAAMVVAVLMRL